LSQGVKALRVFLWSLLILLVAWLAYFFLRESFWVRTPRILVNVYYDNSTAIFADVTQAMRFMYVLLILVLAIGFFAGYVWGKTEN
jgi:hypothetical protein